MKGIENLINLKNLNCKSNQLKDVENLKNLKIEDINVSQNHLSEDDEFYDIISSLKNLQKINLEDNCFENSSKLEKKIKTLIQKKINCENSLSNNSNENQISDNESKNLLLIGVTADSFFKAKNMNNNLKRYFENNLSDTEESFQMSHQKKNFQLSEKIPLTHQENDKKNISENKLFRSEVNEKKKSKIKKNNKFYDFKSFKDQPKIIKMPKKDFHNLKNERKMTPDLNSFKNFAPMKDSKYIKKRNSSKKKIK